MPAPPLSIRSYTPADFERYASLIMEYEKLENENRAVQKIVRETLNRPGYNPEEDLFLIYDGKGALGFLDILPEKGIGRAVTRCYLRPEARGRGLSRKMLRCARARAEQLQLRVLHCSISSAEDSLRRLLALRGFKPVRRHLDLVADISSLSPEEGERETPLLQPMRPGEEEKLRNIQNVSFAGSWGYNPNTLEDITYSLGLSRFLFQDVLFTRDGSKITGFCWNTTRELKGRNTGKVFMLGVDPGYRNKDIGKSLLHAGLRRLKKRGAFAVELTVDAANAPALSLYRAAGFRERSSTHWYELPIA